MAAADLTDEQLQAIAQGQADPTSSMSDSQLQAIVDAENAQHAVAATHAPKGGAPDIVGDLNRAAGLTQRALINGVVGLPGMAMDAGVAGRNAVGDAFNKATGQPATPDYSLPFSQDFQHWLTTSGGMPEPQGPGENAASLGISALGGGELAPLPGVAGLRGSSPTAPEGFVPPNVMRAQLTARLLKDSQDLDFKVPPSTTNPTLGNRTIEGIAGKVNVQNHARIDNDAARTAVAARTLGLKPEVFTPDAVAAVKQEAGQAWEAGRAIPQFKVSDQYLDALAKVEGENTGANESFPGAASPDVSKVIDTYTQPTMTGNAGVSAVKLLRQKASDAFRQGNSEIGRTYKGVAQAIEDEMERAAQNPANGVKPSVIQDIKAARQRYAQASLIEDAMEPNGTVSGPKLAAAWRKDEPISGDLRTAAEFAANYPKANLSSAASGSPVEHLSAGLGPLLSGSLLEHLSEATGHGGGVLPLVAGGVAYPAARAGARAAMLSRWGQARAIPGAAGAASSMPALGPQRLAAALAAFDAQKNGATQ